jgi:hypothetical protein
METTQTKTVKELQIELNKIWWQLAAPETAAEGIVYRTPISDSEGRDTPGREMLIENMYQIKNARRSVRQAIDDLQWKPHQTRGY